MSGRQTLTLDEVADQYLPPGWIDGPRWLARRLNRGELKGVRMGRTWMMTQANVSLSGASRAVMPKHQPWQPCSPPTSYQHHHRYERHCTPSTFTSQKPSTRLAYYPKQPENSRQLSKF